MKDEAIKAAVRGYYARRAKEGGGCGPAGPSAGGAGCCAPAAPAAGEAGGACCAPPAAAGAGSGCCGPEAAASAPWADEIPSYGCGAPFEAGLFRPGDVVVDLGSGPGRDALLAGQAVGPAGRVIGVDMTPEMLARSRAAASRAGGEHVEFRLGDIEALPVADGAADVVISNCVLNLVPDKRRAFAEAFRVLRPGGRLLVNDIVAAAPLPRSARDDLEAWSACVSGAVTADEYRRLLADAGFVEIDVAPSGEGAGAQETYSARVTARKP
jgi:SAM-dependent methyltransferase